MTNRIYLCCAIIFCLAAGAMAQGGGQFTVEKSVIAGGGQTSTGGQFTLDGTNGQTVAGQRAANAAFSLHAGFWNPEQFAPTAAEVTVSGRIITADGRGIRSVRITITGGNGESRTILSGTFGYFRFTEIPSGATYVITVSAKRYQFKEPSQAHTVFKDIDNINFVAVGEQQKGEKENAKLFMEQ